jgi:lysophospholipase L1-like esterase
VRSRMFVGLVSGATVMAIGLTTVIGISSADAARAIRYTSASVPAVHYVALGDSYSSGAGAGDYASSSGSCDRSAKAYPEQWAAKTSPASFTSVACSSATTSSVISSQLSALSPGTTLVSVTIGGNDAGFSGTMETCVLDLLNGPCLNDVASARTFMAKTLPGRLDAMLRDIRAHAPSARIVVLGYPDLYDLSRSGSCIGLSTAKRTALDQGADALDQALSAAAARHGDVFADVRTQFAGHEICDSGGWLHSVTLPIGSSYHPTAAGQDDGYLPVFSKAAG